MFNIQDMEKIFLDVEKRLATHELEEWQENLIHDAVYYGYIGLDQIEESISVIKPYASQEHINDLLISSENKLLVALALASKV
jgi:hypothetical protein